MNKIRSMSQNQLAWLLAFYLGLILNSFTFYRRFPTLLSHQSHLGVYSIVAELAAALLAPYVVLRLFSLPGRWFFKITASLISIVTVACAYYMLVFNVVIGYGIVASALTTDIDLSKEVVGYWFYLWVIILSIPPLMLIFLNRGDGYLWQQLRAPNQHKGILATFILALLFTWLPLKVLDKQYKNQEHNTNVDLPSYGGVVAHSYLPSNWMSAFGVYSWSRFNEDVLSRNLFNPAKHFHYVAPKDLDDTYVVFIIGETTRWDHMGILGYSRDTTPKLAKEPNLVAFRGESCDTATKLSLRCMFVRQGGAGDDPGRTLKEQDVFAVMKELGFSSELFAMQSEVWFYSKTDADNIEFREQIGSEPQNRGKAVDDMLLLPKLQQSIDHHPQGKHLVILHTKGSHYLYSQRYPRSFAYFTPECIGVDDFCSKDQLINAYDNSIRYIDSMLDSVYDELRDKKAIVFYVADHGESINNNMHFHGTPREMAPPEQFRVPIVVWASNKYLAEPDNNARFSLLQQQAKVNVTHKHTDIFDSLLGCLGYTSPDGGINPKNNWCQRP